MNVAKTVDLTHSHYTHTSGNHVMGQRCWLMLLVVIVLQYKRYQINTLEPETYTMLYVNYISIKLRKKLLKKLT